MGYLVFARKYRPQVFEDVIGQDHVTRTLQNAIKAARVPHALLFAGPRGVGKTSAARILAKALNCATGPKPTPCGSCKICQEIASGVSMDVIEIDGASNRGINEIRELRENVKYAPASSRHKIFIIDEVHMLTPEAFNALLKTLEEPPGHVIFIFATTEPNRIPITILSRCQRFDFRRISLTEIIQRLEEIVDQEKISISKDNLLVIARESEGSMRDAQSLLDQVISFAGNEVGDNDVAEVLGVIDRQLLYDVSDAIAKRDAGTCLEILDGLEQHGHDLPGFSRELLQHFRNLMVARIAKNPEKLLDLPKHEVDELIKQSENKDLAHIQQCFTILLQSEGTLSHSTFPKLILETALIKMVDIEPVIPIDEVLHRLELLEKGLSRSGQTPEGGPDIHSGESHEPTVPQRPHKPAPPSNSAEDNDVNKESEDDGAHKAKREATWEKLLASANREKPPLGALLSQGYLIHCDDEHIEIGFKGGSFYYDRIREKANQAVLAGICESLFNRDMRIIFTLVEGAPTNTRATKKKEETDRDRRIRKELLENPIVRDALEVFQGEIEEIKPGARFESQKAK
jgi:DNA polymerase-3 subunit gamma/tau